MQPRSVILQLDMRMRSQDRGGANVGERNRQSDIIIIALRGNDILIKTLNAGNF
jgi:hypothetical protein